MSCLGPKETKMSLIVVVKYLTNIIFIIFVNIMLEFFIHLFIYIAFWTTYMNIT